MPLGRATPLGTTAILDRAGCTSAAPGRDLVLLAAVSLSMAAATGACSVDRSGLVPDLVDGGSVDGGRPRQDAGTQPIDGGANPAMDAAFDASGTPADGGTDGRIDMPSDAGTDARTIPADWWDTNFRRRRRLTFDAATYDQDLTPFAALVVLDATRVDYGRTGPAGEQLRFVDADGRTALPFEIESFVVGGRSHAWVRVPTIDRASSTDHIWMYYDNPAASDGQDAPRVWDDDYRAVFHLNEDFDDSTPAANHGSASAAASATGVIGGARVFGRDEHSTVPDDDTLDITGPITLSGWINPTTTSHNLGILAKREACSNQANYALFVRSDATMLFEHYDRGWRGFGGGAVVTDGWQWLAVTFDPSSNDLVLYVDGVTVSTQNDNRSLLIDRNAIELGRNGGCAGDFMEGALDEVRISAAARTATWISAQFHSMTDQLIAFGPEEGI